MFSMEEQLKINHYLFSMRYMLWIKPFSNSCYSFKSSKALKLQNLTALLSLAILPWTEHLLTSLQYLARDELISYISGEFSEVNVPQRPLCCTYAHHLAKWIHLVSLFLDHPFPHVNSTE